jgi:hypothetical protein
VCVVWQANLGNALRAHGDYLEACDRIATNNLFISQFLNLFDCFFGGASEAVKCPFDPEGYSCSTVPL